MSPGVSTILNGTPGSIASGIPCGRHRSDGPRPEQHIATELIQSRRVGSHGNGGAVRHVVEEVVVPWIVAFCRGHANPDAGQVGLAVRST
jgi:hypothetical protein